MSYPEKKLKLFFVPFTIPLRFILYAMAIERSKTNKECSIMILEKSFPAMGTVNNITILDAEGPAAASDARKYLLGLSRAWTCFQEDSLISQINREAGRSAVSVDEDTLAILKQSQMFSKLTHGVFDVTAGPLAALWKTAMERGERPSDKDIWQALGLVDWNDLLLSEDAGTAALRKPGQWIDLGGTAKGYAADKLRKRLRQHGVQRALLNLGGTVAAMGYATRIGIQDPFRPTGVPMGTLLLEDRCAVTSGVYERCARIDGRRYHHIIDPRTGFPARSGLLSVTLVGDTAAELDALATASVILGLEESAALLNARGIEAVFVTDKGQVLITKELKRKFTLLNQTTYTGGAETSVA